MTTKFTRILGFLITFLAVPVACSADAEESFSAITDSDALFESLDTNDDGSVAFDEVNQDQQRLFRRLLRTADANDDNALSREELAAGLQPQRPQRPMEKLPEELAPQDQPAAVFTRMDKDRDGQLSKGELPTIGRRLWEQFVTNADRNGDSQLNRIEFMRNYYRIAGRLRGGADQSMNFVALAFQRLDSDTDGRIRLQEVPQERRRQFAQLMAFADDDADGALNREEFTNGMQGLQRILAVGVPAADDSAKTDRQVQPQVADSLEAKVKQAMRRIMQLDEDSDGRLSKEEVRGPLGRNFARIDADGSGELDQTELTRAARFMIRSAEANRRREP